MKLKYPLNLLSQNEIDFINNNINLNNIEVKNINLNKLFNIFQEFFNKKKYNNNNFLKSLHNDILNKCNIKIKNKYLYILLIKYHENINNIIKIKKFKAALNVELNLQNQSGGFFTNKDKYSSYTFALNTADLIFDLISILPKDLFSSSSNLITTPFTLVNVVLNLMRGDYEFAFYSILSILPSVGSIISISAKMIHRIIRAITKNKDTGVDKNLKYYKQILSARRVHHFLTKGSNRNNIMEGRFEKEYKSSYDDEYL